LRKARLIGIFRCDFFPFEFALLKSFRNKIGRVLSTCASLYCSHAK